MRLVALLAVVTGSVACGGEGGDGDGDGGPGAADAATVQCEPSGGAPMWIEEGETATATIGCASGLDPDPAGFELGPLPANATYDAGTRTLSFTPGLDQAAVYRIAITAPTTAEVGELKIGVADRFDDPDNVPVVDPAAYTEEYGLPVFFVSPGPTDDVYQPTTVVYGGRTYAIEGKLRGASSLNYPKQSYTLDFSGDHIDDPAHGLIDKKKIVLTTTFDDNSYLRGRLTWDLWNQLQPTVPITAFSAVVFVDGAFYGLYTVTDHIDDETMDAAGLPEDGNLYKAVNHDANFKLTRANGSTKGTLHDGYEKKHGLPDVAEPGAFDDLHALVTFVASSDDATFAAGIADLVDVADFEDWFLLATFLKLDDSAGKNSYLHHSPTTPWHVVPWDFNDSLGQNWYTLREPPTPIDDYAWNNLLFVRLGADPVLGAALDARYAAALGPGGAFELDAVQGRIDAIAAELAPSMARDERRWRTQYLSYGSWTSRNDFTTATEEVAYVRGWIAERWAALADRYE